MASNEDDHYSTLQISHLAEPEVIAAAYRALAKKYHPDRSSAPNAMLRMAQINVAYQALKGRPGVPLPDTPIETGENPTTIGSSFTREHVDPNASLDQIMAIATRKAAIARQQLVDEMTRSGLPPDTAMNVVRQTLRDIAGCGPSATANGRVMSEEHVRPDTSLERALEVVRLQAATARNELVDALMKDGLQRNAALELVDSAFELLRRRPAASGRQRRLSPDRVTQDLSLERGLELTTEKVRTALKFVVDEMTSDGMPQQAAQQLVQAATDGLTRARRR